MTVNDKINEICTIMDSNTALIRTTLEDFAKDSTTSTDNSVIKGKLPLWCKEEYCQSYQFCQLNDPLKGDMPDCFYGNIGRDEHIFMAVMKLLQELGHSRYCALSIIYDEYPSCVCNNSCANVNIDYNFFNINND